MIVRKFDSFNTHQFTDDDECIIYAPDSFHYNSED